MLSRYANKNTALHQVQQVSLHFSVSHCLQSNRSSGPIPTCMFLETLPVSKQETFIYTRPVRYISTSLPTPMTCMCNIIRFNTTQKPEAGADSSSPNETRACAMHAGAGSMRVQEHRSPDRAPTIYSQKEDQTTQQSCNLIF
jgi:hypothetical protein